MPRFRTSTQNSPAEADFFRNHQVTCSERANIEIFHSPDFNVSSHASCSRSSHVTTKHWEKQHHAVTSLFVGHWLLAEHPEILMQCFAFVILLQWTLRCVLNAVKLDWFYVEASNTASQTCEHHVSCHNTTSWRTLRSLSKSFKPGYNDNQIKRLAQV